MIFLFFFSSRRRHTRLTCDWSSDVCSSDLGEEGRPERRGPAGPPGAGPGPREEARGRRPAPTVEGPARVLRRGGAGPSGEARRTAGQGEGPDRVEAKTPGLRSHGCRRRAARPHEARLPVGDAAADGVPQPEQGERADRRTQSVDEAPQGAPIAEGGPGQDREGGPRPRLRNHGPVPRGGRTTRGRARDEREGPRGP